MTTDHTDFTDGKMMAKGKRMKHLLGCGFAALECFLDGQLFSEDRAIYVELQCHSAVVV